MTTDEPVPLLIRLVVDENDDKEQVDATSRALRRELEELPGVEDARQATTAEATEHTAGQGTRSAELITLGAVGLAVLPGAVPALIDFLNEWLLRPGYRPLKIRIPGIDVEYDPRTMTAQELTRLMVSLQRRSQAGQT